MKYDPKKHPFDAAQGRHRRSIRLKRYDYAQAGAYFVTIVTYHRDSLFGKIVDRKMTLNGLGKIADECWRAIPDHFPNVELGVFVVMPNHVHGIIMITNQRRDAALLRPYHDHATNDDHRKINVKPGSLGAIVRSYKSAVSYRINKEHNVTGIWQRNYYEHIIRNDTDLQNKTDYIESNPLLWDEDDENPGNAKSIG